MKKKLSVLIVSCFLLSTPCFAFDKHAPHHKEPMPPKHQPHIEKTAPHHNNIYYYGGSQNVENWAIITESVSNIVDTLFN